MNLESPNTSRPAIQFSLGMLILLTMTIASVIGVGLTIAKRQRLESQVRALEYQERLSQVTFPIHDNLVGNRLFPMMRQWVVYLPPGKAYRLCWKIDDPPVVANQEITEISADEQIPLHSGERQIQMVLHDFQYSSPYIEVQIDGVRGFHRNATKEWLPYEIESLYASADGDLETPLQFPLELCDLIFPANSDEEFKIRKSNLRMWIEEAAP